MSTICAPEAADAAGGALTAVLTMTRWPAPAPRPSSGLGYVGMAPSALRPGPPRPGRVRRGRGQLVRLGRSGLGKYDGARLLVHRVEVVARERGQCATGERRD